ncbi:MAG TPA: aminoglycoside phosphotransferase family protein [Terriglobales bacterium]|nr:aminoglycoside phosphotransferase family protein [Terriglobales bacterium]
MQADMEFEGDKQLGVIPASDRHSKDALARKAAELTANEFVRERILPLLNGSVAERPFTASVAQNTGTGRLALIYEFASDCGAVAKLYTDELGPRSYAALQALWNGGFGPESRYQVPEPLGFLADHNLLLMRRVPGVSISAAIRGDNSIDLVESCREAARWLVALHRSSLDIGQRETDWDSLKLFRMSTRFLKAAAAKPEHLDTMRDLLDAVEERILNLHHDRRLVQTHGRYHSDHVLISPQATCVIDLDRVGWSDPGKDIAEFVRVLRSTAFKNGDDMARIDQATAAFLEEYLGHLPEAAKTLGCYWASFSFHSYLGVMKKTRDKARRTWQELIDFYSNEIRCALQYGI